MRYRERAQYVLHINKCSTILPRTSIGGHDGSRWAYAVGWKDYLLRRLGRVGMGACFTLMLQGGCLAVGLPQRNLFELSIVCFVICMASELRARGQAA